MAIIKQFLKRLKSREEPPQPQEAQPDLSVMDFNNPDFIANPYPFFLYWQQHMPVTRLPSGAWVLSRQRDISKALDNEHLSNVPPPYGILHPKKADQYVCADIASRIIPFLDGPVHAVKRRLTGQVFIEQMRNNPAPVKNMASELLAEAFDTNNKADLLADFCTPFTVKLMSHYFNIRSPDILQLKQWCDWFFYLFSIIPSQAVQQELDRQLTDFRAVFEQLLADRKAEPGNDMISGLIDARDDNGQQLDDRDIIDTCLLLFADGVNTDYAITNAIATLLTHRQQLTLLQQQPDLLEQAVDECLRFESPSLFIGRTALKDIEIDGHIIKQHTPVLLLLAAANHDTEHYAAPQSFDITRSRNTLTFGKGQHTCLGQSLARQMLATAIEALLPEMNKIELTGEMSWQQRTGHRWPESLPVKYST